MDAGRFINTDEVDFTMHYTYLYDIDKKGQLKLVDNIAKQLHGDSKGAYSIRTTRIPAVKNKYLRFKIEGFLPGQSYQEKNLSGDREVLRSIPDKTVLVENRVLNIVTCCIGIGW
jgi:hypothetical protein